MINMFSPLEQFEIGIFYSFFVNIFTNLSFLVIFFFISLNLLGIGIMKTKYCLIPPDPEKIVMDFFTNLRSNYNEYLINTSNIPSNIPDDDSSRIFLLLVFFSFTLCAVGYYYYYYNSSEKVKELEYLFERDLNGIYIPLTIDEIKNDNFDVCMEIKNFCKSINNKIDSFCDDFLGSSSDHFKDLLKVKINTCVEMILETSSFDDGLGKFIGLKIFGIFIMNVLLPGLETIYDPTLFAEINEDEVLNFIDNLILIFKSHFRLEVKTLLAKIKGKSDLIINAGSDQGESDFFDGSEEILP